METVTLTTPISSVRVRSLLLDWVNAFIHIEVGSDEVQWRFTYNGPEAAALMTALNKLDLSTKSLHRRIIERLIADGKLVGTVAGTPD